MFSKAFSARSMATTMTRMTTNKTTMMTNTTRSFSRMPTTSLLNRTHAMTIPRMTVVQHQVRSKASVALQEPTTLLQSPASKLGAVLFLLAMGQYGFGNATNFFEHRFTVHGKDPQDLADFYGTEDFMELFCVFPFMVNFMMRQAEFDDEGNIHAWGISGPGNLKVTIEFDEHEEENDDGEEVISYFNKRETFADVIPEWVPLLGGKTIWRMTQNFGYKLKDDGSGDAEIIHQGEEFAGFFPMRVVFALHSRYVIWATQRYVTSPDFGNEDRTDEAEELRQNIPLHEFNVFVDGLSKQIETALASPDNASEEKQQALKSTLQRLDTVRKMDQSEIKPSLVTLRSRKSHISSVHLHVNDQETKEALQQAMEQIGSNKSAGGRQEPVQRMRTLQRRTTLAIMKEDEIKPKRRKFLGLF